MDQLHFKREYILHFYKNKELSKTINVIEESAADALFKNVYSNGYWNKCVVKGKLESDRYEYHTFLETPDNKDSYIECNCAGCSYFINKRKSRFVESTK